VVNLDGLANDDRMVEALRRDAVPEYLCRSPIRFLLHDRPWLGGWDPARPERPPPRPDSVGGTLHRLHALSDCDVREVPGAPGDWAVVEIIHGGAETVGGR
jgi:hypothetical protein